MLVLSSILQEVAVRTGNGIIKRLLRQLAGLVRRVQDLVVEDREVQRETKADGVRRSQAVSSNFGGSLVGLERLVGGSLALVANSELSQVTVVITLPVVRMN
jgi:hypothetical protein